VAPPPAMVIGRRASVGREARRDAPGLHRKPTLLSSHPERWAVLGGLAARYYAWGKWTKSGLWARLPLSWVPGPVKE